MGDWALVAIATVVIAYAALSGLLVRTPVTVGITVGGGRIVEIDIVADPERLRRLELTILDD